MWLGNKRDGSPLIYELDAVATLQPQEPPFISVPHPGFDRSETNPHVTKYALVEQTSRPPTPTHVRNLCSVKYLAAPILGPLTLVPLALLIIIFIPPRDTLLLLNQDGSHEDN